MLSYLAIFIGGGLGSLCRFWISSVFQQQNFPWGTLAANFLSTFILGILLARFGADKTALWLFLAVGFCGGFSTFSTFGMELVLILNKGMLWMSLAYVLLSVTGAVVCFWMGFKIISAVSIS